MFAKRSGVTIRTQETADNLAIGMSALCLVHCLILPLIIVLLPNATLVFFSDEIFHQAMLLGILPLSLVALFIGFRHHKDPTVIGIGSAGLSLLIIASVAGHSILGETGEVALTVIGSLIIAFAHFKNAKQRRCIN